MKNLKILFLLLFSVLFQIGCSTNEETENFHTNKARGKVVRELTNENLAGKTIFLKSVKVYGTGHSSYSKIIDSKEVTTNAEGTFELDMKNSDNTYLTVYKYSDDNYSGFGASEAFPGNEFSPNDEVLIKIQKFIKFRINLKNTTPVNDDDYVNVNFIYSTGQTIRTQILNFGIPNIIYPAENLAGGGQIGPRVESAWQGMNVNSAIFYSVSEDSQIFKLYWEKKKNGIVEKGVTNEIQNNINIVNEYDFNY